MQMWPSYNTICTGCLSRKLTTILKGVRFLLTIKAAVRASFTETPCEDSPDSLNRKTEQL